MQFINLKLKGVGFRTFHIKLSVTMVIDFEGRVNPLCVAYDVQR